MPNLNHRNNESLRKRLEWKAAKAELADNQGSGSAACIGNMDRGGDVIFPGAFSKGKCLKNFLKNGSVCLGHDWAGLQIGMPLSAEEVGNALTCTWEYHSTDASQTARVVAQERLAKGLDVGLSIGFSIAESMWFESGEQLLKYAKDNGYDMSLFDAKSIKAWKDPYWGTQCRGIFEVNELYEFSQVTVPMNPGAIMTEAKSLILSLPELKSLPNSVSAILQAKIHQAFTVAADELAVRGYMDVSERIAISTNIGDALKLFAASLDSNVGDRVVDSTDVDRIASKQADPSHPSDSVETIDAVTRARALKSQADYAMANL